MFGSHLYQNSAIELNLFEAGVIQSHIADHFSIFATVPISIQDICDNTTITNNVNYNLLGKPLNQENRTISNSTSNVNKLVDILYAKLLK